MAAGHRICQVSSKRRHVEAVDDGVAAGVQVPKDKEHVVDVLGRVPDHGGVEPVPDSQQVIRGPAHHEGANDRHGHLEGLGTGFGDAVSAAAPQAAIIICTQEKSSVEAGGTVPGTGV